MDRLITAAACSVRAGPRTLRGRGCRPRPWS